MINEKKAVSSEKRAALYRAIQRLTPYSRFKLANVYNGDEFPASAVLAILPNFEYRDWSYQKVAAIIRRGQQKVLEV